MKNFKLANLWMFVVAIAFVSCEQNESFEANGSDTLSEFLKSNDLTTESKIVHNGEVTKISELSDEAAIANIISLYSDAFTIHQDGDYNFLYTESQSASANFDQIDDFEFNNIEDSNKANDPVLYSVILYKDINFKGKRLRYNFRRGKLRRLVNKVELIRLSRIRDGRFDNNISSVKYITSKAGRNANIVLQAFFSRSHSVKDEFLGSIAPFGSDMNNVSVRNLGKLDFSDGGFDPRGVFSLTPLSQNEGKADWDDQFSLVEFSAFR